MLMLILILLSGFGAFAMLRHDAAEPEPFAPFQDESTLPGSPESDWLVRVSGTQT